MLDLFASFAARCCTKNCLYSACFILRPCKRLMMISRMRGRCTSSTAGEASSERQRSRQSRRSSGTELRSLISMPYEPNASLAELKSLPSRT